METDLIRNVFSVSTESTKVSMDTNKQPAFSTDTGHYTSQAVVQTRTDSFASEPSFCIRRSYLRTDRFVNQNQFSQSRREGTRSPVRNEPTLRETLNISCYNLL
jgi:hypothetical protein